MHRLVLLLVFLPLSLSHPTVPLSLRWQYINYEDRPTDCVPASTTPKPQPQHLKRKLPQSPSEKEQPNPFTAATTTSPTTVIHRPRGNPLCYYPISRTSTYLYEGYQSIPFILPAGIYALKWNTGHSTKSFANIAFYIEVLQKSPHLEMFAYVQAIRTYGGTLVSDGVHELALVLKNMNPQGLKQSAEV
ncbi:hypothetical protein MMC14_001743 [Varicellaria rhodocarpa]|nr:hypothetical protein [Varicellaria rhodocarpa]